MADRAIAMMASEPFMFHGRPVAVFDHFDATPEEAKTLISRGYAVVRRRRYQTADIGQTPETTVDVAPADTTRRRYRRRDMTSEKA